MRFYTVEIAGREEILVGFHENEAVYRLNLLARLVPELAVADMNELICRYTPEVKAKLERLADNDDVLQGAAVKLAEVKLLAPIVHPRQDVVCLGINYDAHAQEAGRFPAKPSVVNAPTQFTFPSVLTEQPQAARVFLVMKA